MSNFYEAKPIPRSTFNVSPTASLNPEEQAKIIQQLRTLSRVMDRAVKIPGTQKSFGLDSVIGLIPGVGDTVTTGVSLWIVYQAHRLGVPRTTLARMLANIGIDAAVGSIPLLGDIFDLFFKANVKNLALLGIETPGPRK